MWNVCLYIRKCDFLFDFLSIFSEIPVRRRYLNSRPYCGSEFNLLNLVSMISFVLRVSRCRNNRVSLLPLFLFCDHIQESDSGTGRFFQIFKRHLPVCSQTKYRPLSGRGCIPIIYLTLELHYTLANNLFTWSRINNSRIAKQSVTFSCKLFPIKDSERSLSTCKDQG